MALSRKSRATARAITTLLILFALLPAIASAQSPQFGAWNPGDPYDGHTNGALALQTATGRHVDIVSWYQSWGGGDWISAVQPHAIGAVAGAGRTPMLTWEPWAPGGGTDQPEFRLQRIASGDFDAYITSWAAALKLTGSPVYLRPMHEMNADWYPWGGTVNGNSPALYVAAWRHMVDIFRAAGANNVRFVWSPNNIDVPATNKLESYYPGTSYVDVLAVDGYNWGAGTPQFGGWQSFSDVFMRAYDRLRVLGPQPIWIAEVATSDDGGDKAAWIRDMFVQAATMNRLKAIVWFNENKERDWRAASTATTARAFTPGAAGAAGVGATTARPRLALTLNGRARAGRKSIVRWRGTNAAAVVSWRTYLNGRRVTTTSNKRTRIARKHIARAGRYEWTVTGRDGRGRAIVSARRSFRVS